MKDIFYSNFARFRNISPTIFIIEHMQFPPQSILFLCCVSNGQLSKNKQNVNIWGSKVLQVSSSLVSKYICICLVQPFRPNKFPPNKRYFSRIFQNVSNIWRERLSSKSYLGISIHQRETTYIGFERVYHALQFNIIGTYYGNYIFTCCPLEKMWKKHGKRTIFRRL